MCVLCRSPIHPDTARMLAGLIYARMLEVWCQGDIWCFFSDTAMLESQVHKVLSLFLKNGPKHLPLRRRCCWTQGSCFVSQILLLSSALVEAAIGLKVVGSSSWNPKMTQVLWLPGSMRRNISKSWWHLGWIRYIDWAWLLQRFFYVHQLGGKLSNLRNIFQGGWNHQLVDSRW